MPCAFPPDPPPPPRAAPAGRTARQIQIQTSVLKFERGDYSCPGRRCALTSRSAVTTAHSTGRSSYAMLHLFLRESKHWKRNRKGGFQKNLPSYEPLLHRFTLAAWIGTCGVRVCGQLGSVMSTEDSIFRSTIHYEGVRFRIKYRSQQPQGN